MMNQNLIANLGDLFFEFQSKLPFYEREYLKAYNITDVTPTEVKVLYIIGLSNTKSMSDIAKKLHITKGSLSITINSLVNKGYVIRTRNKQDRRIIILYLTNKSLDAVKTYSKFYELLIARLVKVLSAEKLLTLNDVLFELNNLLEDIPNNQKN